jgi:hypothetical protein
MRVKNRKYSVYPVTEGYWVVNIFDEPVQDANGVILNKNKDDAQKLCDSLNVVPEGAVLTNVE